VLLVCMVCSCSFPDVNGEIFSSCSVGCTGHDRTLLVLMVVMRVWCLLSVNCNHKAITICGLSYGTVKLLLWSKWQWWWLLWSRW
jgi:hypothetical protein